MYGLIGTKLGHSYSAEIHGMMGNQGYRFLEMTEEELDVFLRKKEFLGVNVTIPYKKTVIPYCDEISETAQRIGSVNTIVNRGGKLWGHNTDYAGLAAMAERAGIDFRGRKVLIFGAGGTSLTAQAVAKDAGAASVLVKHRNDVIDDGDSEILINTTPVGMYPENGNTIAHVRDYPKCIGVLDVIYNPLRTRFLLENESLPHTGGLSMLAAQAFYSAECFGTASGTVDALIKACEKKYRNIVLCGMPGSGKSTIGTMLAKEMGLPFIDTDTVLAEKTGMQAGDYITKYGEAAFRAAERDVIADIGKKIGQVIATGGGAMMDMENVWNLRQNGTVIYIDRPLSDLATIGRPLSTNLESLYEKRHQRYVDASDFIVQNAGTPIEAVRQITERIQL